MQVEGFLANASCKNLMYSIIMKQGRIQDFVKAGVLISHTLNHTHSHTQSTEEKLSCDSFYMGATIQKSWSYVCASS